MSDKTVGYVRVSTFKQQRSGLSVEAQKDKIKQYASLADLEMNSAIGEFGILLDEGYTGSNKSRPGLQELLSLVKDKRELSHIVFTSFDRLSRNTKELLEILQLCEERRVAVHSIRESFDTSTPIGKTVVTILAAINEMECMNVSIRTKDAHRKQRENGDVYSRIPPFGYKRHGKKLVKDTEEHKALTLIRNMGAKKYSNGDIIRALQEKGMSTRSGAKWQYQHITKLINRTPIGEKEPMKVDTRFP